MVQGCEDDVEGQIMFLHLRQGVTVGQVLVCATSVVLCTDICY